MGWDFLVPQDKGTEVPWLSWDKGTTGQVQNLAMGWAGTGFWHLAKGWAWMGLDGILPAGYCQHVPSCSIPPWDKTWDRSKKRVKKSTNFQNNLFLLLPLLRDKGTTRQENIFVPYQRDHDKSLRRLSRPLETLLSTNSNAAGHSTLTSFADIGWNICRMTKCSSCCCAVICRNLCRKETKWFWLKIQDPEMQKPLQTQGPNEPPIVKTGYRRPTEL